MKDPVWTLFSRRTFSRLAYWLSALGYNLRDRSATNRMYFIYFCAFWLVWAVAVFALLGGGAANIFQTLQGVDPPGLVVTFGELGVLVWALFLLWRVTRRSPFVFSEEDAYLLCQTPVDRRKVGLAWFFQGWMSAVLPFAFGAIILSFALVEWQLQNQVSILQVFAYLSASLRALALILPLHMAVQAALWGLGALRLRKRPQQPWLRWVFPLVFLIVLAGVLVPGLGAYLLAPLSLPLEAAFLTGISRLDWLVGLGLSLLYLGAGLFFLTYQSKEMKLAWAAQETSHIAAIQLARSYLSFDLAEAITLRRRLGTARAPSRIPARPGAPVLFWKDILQTLRTLDFRWSVNWIWLFGLSLGMFLPSSWAVQMIIGGVWTISVGGLVTRRLRNDLAHWWILRSLPLKTLDLLRAELVLSGGLCVLLSWTGLVFSRLPLISSLIALALLPLLAASAALATLTDIFRRSKARTLMSPSIAEENVPRQNLWGVVQALITVLIPLGLFTWQSADPAGAFWGVVAFPLAGLFTLINVQSAISAYRWIE
jgi:hypothetical protein